MEADGYLDSPATLAYHAAMAAIELIETGTDEAPRHPRKPLVSYPPASELAFPGCKPVRLPREALELYDGRLEFWDGATETAWVCEPNSPYHEKPGGALPSLVERIAQVRGSPVTCYGSMDLMVRDAGGLPWRILQADQSVYLHPGRARLPGAVAMEVGEHDLPDVVLEVDHTTDVYRGKLRLYEGVGVPGGVGGGAELSGGEPTEAPARGADDSRAGGGRVPGVSGEPCVSGVECGGVARGVQRAGAFGADV